MKLLKKLWDSKTTFLEKIGIFEGIPEMLGSKYDLYKETTDFSSELSKNAEKRNAKLKETRRQEKIDKDALLERLLYGSKTKAKRN